MGNLAGGPELQIDTNWGCNKIESFLAYELILMLVQIPSCLDSDHCRTHWSELHADPHGVRLPKLVSTSELTIDGQTHLKDRQRQMQGAA